MGRRLLALASAVLILPSSASATLIALDLLAAGDGLVTRDTATGLDWLDVTATENRSYNDIEADVGGWISLGFRHATGTEVCGFFATYALAPAPCPMAISAGGTGNLVATVQGLVGRTASNFRLDSADGRFDDGDASDGRVGFARLSYALLSDSSLATVDGNHSANTAADPSVGHWLVRPVPEPSTAVLLAAGTLALAVGRRKCA